MVQGHHVNHVSSPLRLKPRRWRWWNILLLFIAVFSIVEFMYSVLLSQVTERPVNIGNKQGTKIGQ